MRLYGRARRGAALAGRRLEAVPGSLLVAGPEGERRVTAGPQGEVTRAVHLDDAPDPGRVLLLGPDGQAVLDLAVHDWVPSLVGLDPHSRGGSDDELTWSGFGLLLETAGIPVREDVLREPREDDVVEVPPPPAVRAVLPVLLLALAVSLVGLRIADTVELAGLALALLGGALGLVVDRDWRARREAGALVGEVLAPAPCGPVTPRFPRRARVVLAPARGPLDTVAVVGPDEDQAWFDGPAGPAGLRTVRVVTPRGADRPERADLVDGLGREVLRLPWDDWFAGPGGPALLARLEARGLRVEHASGDALGEDVLQVYGWPRSTAYATVLLDTAPDAGLRRRTAVVGVLFGVGALLLADGLPVLVGLLVAGVLAGPLAVALLSRLWLDRPRLATAS